MGGEHGVSETIRCDMQLFWRPLKCYRV